MVKKTALRISFTIPNLSSQIPVGGFPVSLFSSNWAISSPFRKKYINRNYFTVLTLFSKRKLLPHSNFFCKKVRHKCWVTLMAFASINPTNPRTNLWNFGKKFGDFEKRTFWKIGHFEFFSSNFFFFFASFSWKSVQICMVEWMGRNFDVFPGFQQIPCYA